MARDCERRALETGSGANSVSFATTMIPRYPDSLSSDQIVALFRDHDHNIWVGTTGGGLDRFTYRQLPFKPTSMKNSIPTAWKAITRPPYLRTATESCGSGACKALTRIDRKTGSLPFTEPRDGRVASPVRG